MARTVRATTLEHSVRPNRDFGPNLIEASAHSAQQLEHFLVRFGRRFVCSAENRTGTKLELNQWFGRAQFEPGHFKSQNCHPFQTQLHPEYQGPKMGPKMATENKRNFNEEEIRQMRDGQIGLQAGQNKGYTQAKSMISILNSQLFVFLVICIMHRVFPPN